MSMFRSRSYCGAVDRGFIKFDRSRKLCWASVVLILLRFASFSNIVINTEKPQIFDQSLEQLAETKTFRLFIKKVNNNIEFID